MTNPNEMESDLNTSDSFLYSQPQALTLNDLLDKEWSDYINQMKLFTHEPPISLLSKAYYNPLSQSTYFYTPIPQPNNTNSNLNSPLSSPLSPFNVQPNENDTNLNGHTDQSANDEDSSNPNSNKRKTWAEALKSPAPPNSTQQNPGKNKQNSKKANGSPNANSQPKTVIATPTKKTPIQPSKPTTNTKLLSDQFNPKNFDGNPKIAKFYVIKSYSEDDVHKSVKYGVWASTENGNRRLDHGFREASEKGPIYLFFSVNTSGQFCGMARMTSTVEFNKKHPFWSDDKWMGSFNVKWIFVKDIPNSQFRHIILENNESKPVTKSRDTQEVPLEKGKEMLRIFATYKHKTSIIDDFTYYDQRQKEMEETRRRKAEGLDVDEYDDDEDDNQSYNSNSNNTNSNSNNTNTNTTYEQNIPPRIKRTKKL